MSKIHNYILLGLVIPLFGVAQKKRDSLLVSKIDEVLVTGTRTERLASSLPLPSQIITAESIKKTGLSRLNEIVQEQTGLAIVAGHTSGEGVQMQGMDAAYTQILIDGQPMMGRMAGNLDLTRISVHNIEKIEVIKGASSCLYGSDALAGVINIITKKTLIDNKLRLNANYKLARFNTNDVSVGVDYDKNKIGFEIFGNYFRSDGYNLSQNSFLNTVEPFQNFTIQPKVKILFNDKMNLTLSSRYYQQNQDYKAQISNENFGGESLIKEWNNALLFNHKLSDRLKMVYDIYATNYIANEHLNRANGTLLEEQNFNQKFFRPEVRANYKIGTKDVFTVGIGLTNETLDRTLFRSKAILNSEYFFAQYEWFISEKWNILGGFRYDYHHQYESQFSPKLGINYQWNQNLNLKASLGFGYKAPDLRQLYLDFTNSSVGYSVLGYNVAESRLQDFIAQNQILFTNQHYSFKNPLKPERSMSINAGGVYQTEKWKIDVNLFYNKINHLIETRAIAQKINGQNIFSYFNLDEIYTTGVELNSMVKIFQNLEFSGGYQFLIAKDLGVERKIKNGEIYARNPETMDSFKLKSSDYFGLMNRSRHTTNFKIDYKIPNIKTTLSLRLLYRSQYGLFDTNNNNILDQYDEFVKGYTLTNLTISKEFRHGISAQIGVLNLLNYKDTKHITNLPGIQPFVRMNYQF